MDNCGKVECLSIEGAVVDIAFEPSDCLAVGSIAVVYMEVAEVPFPFRGFLVALSGEPLQKYFKGKVSGTFGCMLEHWLHQMADKKGSYNMQE